MNKKDIFEYIKQFQLVKLTEGYRINDFDCGQQEYNSFLYEDALEFQEKNLSKTHLLINKSNGDVVGYIVLLSASITLNKEEKTGHEMEGVLFSSFPCIKIGKLAVAQKYTEQYKQIGKLLIEIARGIITDTNNQGVAVRFIVVDADISSNPGIDKMYEKYGFKYNEKHNNPKSKTLSMRLDVFTD